MDGANPDGTTLKRSLGTLESYAVLIGILVGAGIFRVTSDATGLTGPSVILGHLILAPVVLATAVAYLVFLTTPLGALPGGEILHIDRTLRSERLTFLAAWLKLISYLGAAAYLADALAHNILELSDPGGTPDAGATTAVALTALAFFCVVHAVGVGWFGRLQVAMCTVLALSLALLILPGLFAIDVDNYRPFFTHGAAGFGRALPPLFFAYAGFEALSQAAGEVRDSRTRLPRVFAVGIAVTMVVFVAMSAVAFGVLPAAELGASGVPMTAAAARYLPFGATLIVTLGAIMAIATSLNATMLVPARLAWHLAREGRMPRFLGYLHPTLRTPLPGLLLSFGVAALLLVSGRMGLALGISVVALMTLYALHSIALLLLPRTHPELYSQVATRIPRWIQIAAAALSTAALSFLIGMQFFGDLRRAMDSPFLPRLAALDFTSLELLIAWLSLGLILHAGSRRRQSK